VANADRVIYGPAMVAELRSCARTACRWPATASLSFHYDTRRVWLVDLPDEKSPSLYDLCPHHAGTLTVPRGWEQMDERTNRPAPHEPAGRELVERASFGRGRMNRYALLTSELPRIAAEVAARPSTHGRRHGSPPATGDAGLPDGEGPVEHPGQLAISVEGQPPPDGLLSAEAARGLVVSIESASGTRRRASRGDD
jgi:hypothetical protein